MLCLYVPLPRAAAAVHFLLVACWPVVGYNGNTSSEGSNSYSYTSVCSIRMHLLVNIELVHLFPFDFVSLYPSL